MLVTLCMKPRRITLIALFAAMTAAGSIVRVPLTPVPITLQSFSVLLAGVILGPIEGSMSQVVYVITGLLGLPVFSGGGGISYIMKPSFGFLLGFMCAPYAVGLYLEKTAYTKARIFIACLIGTSVIYLLGMPYLAFYLQYILMKPDAITFSIKVGMLIFLPGDILKCVIIPMVALPIRSMVEGNSIWKK